MASSRESKTDTGASADDTTSSKNNGKYNLRRKTLVTRQETEKRLKSPKLPKPKSRPPPLSKYRRKTANSRERGRMQEINVAFQKLQTVLPAQCLAQAESKCAHLTKITTLRLAVNYIAALRGVLGDQGTSILETKNNQTGPQETENIDSQGNVEPDNSVRAAEKGMFLNKTTKDISAEEQHVYTQQMEKDQSICAQSKESIPNKEVTSTEQSKLDSDLRAGLTNPVLSRTEHGIQRTSGGALSSQKGLFSFNTTDINNNERNDDLTCPPFQEGHVHIDRVSSPYSSITDTSMQPHSPSTDTCNEPHSSTIVSIIQTHSLSTDTFTQAQSSTTDSIHHSHISTPDINIRPHSPNTDSIHHSHISTPDINIRPHSPNTDSIRHSHISTPDINIRPHSSTTHNIHHPHISATDTYPAVYGVNDNVGDVTPILLWGEPFSESQSHTNMDIFTGEPFPELQSHTNMDTFSGEQFPELQSHTNMDTFTGEQFPESQSHTKMDTFTGEPFPESQAHLTADTAKAASRKMLAHTAAMESVSDIFVHTNILKAVIDNQFK